MLKSIWVSADGRATPVQDMTDDHLCNSVQYMRKRFKAIFQNKSAAAMLEWTKLWTLGQIDARICVQWPVVRELLDEAKKRGLNV